MDECPKGMGKQSSETVEKGFRNNLFASEGIIQIDITDNEEGDFWEQTSATFAADGSHVIIQTPSNVYKVSLNQEDMQNLYSCQELDNLREKDFKLLQLGDSKLITYSKDLEKGKIVFKPVQSNEEYDFCDLELTLRENLEILEAFQFKRGDRNLLKVNAISNNEELISWEVEKTEAGAQNEILKSINNSAELSTFRFPFYAKCQDRHELLLTSSFHKRIIVNYKLKQVSKDDRITALVFSERGNLYILTESKDQWKLFRIKVKADFKKTDQYSSIKTSQINNADHDAEQETLIFSQDKGDHNNHPNS